MNNNIQIFKNSDFGEIRTLEENGAVLFCGSDVAKALGYARPNDAVTQHCRATVKRRTPISGKMQDINFIPESDLYRLVFSSKLPTAEKFTDWVTAEVLPSIRRNGGYIAGQESMTPEELMAKALTVAQRTLAEREARISQLSTQAAIMAPKADYFDELVERNTLTNFRETAKQLEVGPKAFITFLLERKYIYRDKRGKLLPYADKNDGLFEVKECFNDKTQWSGTQTLVTPKGRETFRLLCQGM
ncbi:phage antirepressor KilAC domain-containing protein [Colidextribacter sp. 210702-DFI.3.9]|nr:phage antirepressor KilAC domain-containing protein [Colidextribacter sp. 210702-DFI.3.9]